MQSFFNTTEITLKDADYQREKTVWAHIRDLISAEEAANAPETRAAKAAARQARCLRRQVEILRWHLRMRPHRAQEEFSVRYAERFTDDLLTRKDEILKQVRKFFRRRHLVQDLEEHEPNLLTWVTADLRALARAELLEVTPQEMKKEGKEKDLQEPPTQLKETPEQFLDRKLKFLLSRLSQQAAIKRTIDDFVETQVERIGDEDERERERERLRVRPRSLGGSTEFW